VIYPVKSNPLVILNRWIPEGENKHLAVDIQNDFKQPVFLMTDSILEDYGKTKTGANYMMFYIPEYDIYASYVHTSMLNHMELNKLIDCGTPNNPMAIGFSDKSGSTSEGAHLHLALFESDGETHIEPFEWMKQNGLYHILEPEYKIKLIGKGVNVEELEWVV
jgi:hypothetical protein